MQEETKLSQETAAILAGLRLLQRAGQDLPHGIRDIATDGGDQFMLDSAAIDNLCERINCDGITIGGAA